MFYQKAIAAWRTNDSGFGRSQLVKSYLQAVEGLTQPEAITGVEAVKAPASLSGLFHHAPRHA